MLFSVVIVVAVGTSGRVEADEIRDDAIGSRARGSAGCFVGIIALTPSSPKFVINPWSQEKRKRRKTK